MTMTPLTPVTERPQVDPRIWTRRVAVTRARGRRRLRIVLAVVGAVCSRRLLSPRCTPGSSVRDTCLSRGAIHTPESEVSRRRDSNHTRHS